MDDLAEDLERTPFPAEWNGEADDDILRLVMEVFPGARWTTREEYRRLARLRDHQARRRRA